MDEEKELNTSDMESDQKRRDDPGTLDDDFYTEIGENEDGTTDDSEGFRRTNSEDEEVEPGV